MKEIAHEPTERDDAFERVAESRGADEYRTASRVSSSPQRA